MGRQVPFVHCPLCSPSFPPLPPALPPSLPLPVPLSHRYWLVLPSPPASSGSGPGHTDAQRAVLAPAPFPEEEDCSLLAVLPKPHSPEEFA